MIYSSYALTSFGVTQRAIERCTGILGKLCVPLRMMEGWVFAFSIYAFNLAMLAKQAWRVVQNPSSLVGHIYTTHYFPRSSFWDASLGSSPSYS